MVEIKRDFEMPRIYTAQALDLESCINLDDGAARHVQVLRMQPKMNLTLFNGLGGQYEAEIEKMTRNSVCVRVLSHQTIERESARQVHIALGMPANERMDWLVEKATELGVSSIAPLITERSVLRLNAEQAAKKRERWLQIAISACEQCGRNKVPVILKPYSYDEWLNSTADIAQAAPEFVAYKNAHQGLLSLKTGAKSLSEWTQSHTSQAPVLLLAGPEGGLSSAEEHAALAKGFSPVTLGSRTLRAETAPLATLSYFNFAE